MLNSTSERWLTRKQNTIYEFAFINKTRLKTTAGVGPTFNFLSLAILSIGEFTTVWTKLNLFTN